MAFGFGKPNPDQKTKTKKKKNKKKKKKNKKKKKKNACYKAYSTKQNTSLALFRNFVSFFFFFFFFSYIQKTSIFYVHSCITRMTEDLH